MLPAKDLLDSNGFSKSRPRAPLPHIGRVGWAVGRFLVVFLAFSRILSIFVGKFWKTGASHDAVADLSGGEMKVLMALQPGTLTKNYINTN